MIADESKLREACAHSHNVPPLISHSALYPYQPYTLTPLQYTLEGVLLSELQFITSQHRFTLFSTFAHPRQGRRIIATESDGHKYAKNATGRYFSAKEVMRERSRTLRRVRVGERRAMLAATGQHARLAVQSLGEVVPLKQPPEGEEDAARVRRGVTADATRSYGCIEDVTSTVNGSSRFEQHVRSNEHC